MKLDIPLIGVSSAAISGIFISLYLNLADIPHLFTHRAFVTQSSSSSHTLDYDTHFGENWQSVRTFRLLTPLEKPLKVYIEEHPKSGARYLPQYKRYVLESLEEWRKALDGRLSYVLTNRSRDADITLNWVPVFSDRYVAGITTYRIGHASIDIKTVGVPEMDIKCNIMHEIGHALGITGHSGNPDDIMVGVRRWRREHNSTYHPMLSKRDTQAIKHLYSSSWSRGEDLYAARAQSVPVVYESAPVQSVIRLPQPTQGTVVIPLPIGGESSVIQWEGQ